MTLGAKSFRRGNHVTTITQNFTPVSFTSIVTLHPVELLLGAAVLIPYT